MKQKIEEVLDSIKESKHKVRVFFRMIKIGLCNLWSYKSVVWNDRDWDYAYFHYIYKHKLEKALKHFSNPENVQMMEERRLFIVKYMKISLSLLNKMIEDDFMNEEDKKIIGQSEMVFVPCNDGTGNSYIQFSDFPTKEMRKDIHDREEVRRKKVVNLFYKILKTRSGYWWD